MSLAVVAMARKISREELIDDLHQTTEKLGRPPKSTEVAEHCQFSIMPYKRVFGKWNDALRAAGLELHRRSSISEEELLDDLRRVAAEVGRTPAESDVRDHGDFADITYIDRFGSWNDAVRAAGFEPNLRYDVTEHELIEEIHRLKEECGRTPRQDDMAERGKFGVNRYWNHFGGWNNALDAAGIRPNVLRDIPEEDLLDKLRRVADEYDSTAAAYMNAYGQYSERPYFRQFGSWDAAVEAAGLEPYEPYGGPDHYLWNGGALDYGEGWTEPKREAVRERDGRVCQNPGCGRTQEEHLEMFGEKHTVHHIMKARTFDDPIERNDMSNLITLCRNPCHRYWEAMSPLRPDTLD